MSAISLTSVFKYAFSLFLGVMGFVPYEQSGLSPEESPAIEIVFEENNSCSKLTYLSGDGIPGYLNGEICIVNI